MDDNPWVLVVMPFHNGERFLDEAIRSVRAQGIASWRLVLVDDGSRDGSMGIAARHCAEDPDRIRCVRHPDGSNRGLAASRNLALKQATDEEFIAFLDCDDIWLPDYLKQMRIAFRQHPDAAMVCSRTMFWHRWPGHAPDAPPDAFTDVPPMLDHLYQPPELLRHVLEDESLCPTTCGTVLRKVAVDSVGGFDPAIPGIYEDLLLFSRIMLRYPVFVSSECWSRYRKHADSHCAIAARSQFHDVHRLNRARQSFLLCLRASLKCKERSDASILDAVEGQLSPYVDPTMHLSVSNFIADELDERIAARNVEGCMAGHYADGHCLELWGWIVSKSQAVVAVDLHDNGIPVGTLPLDRVRPDVAGAYKCDTNQLGFHGTVSVPAGMGRQLTLSARFADGARTRIGTFAACSARLLPDRSNPPSPAWPGCPRGLILMYHSIGSVLPDPCGIRIGADRFREHLEMLRRYARVVPLRQLPATLAGRCDRPVVAITFDDGYADNFHVARPLLHEADLPATFFVNSVNGAIQEHWWDRLESIVLETPSLPVTLETTIGGQPFSFRLDESLNASQCVSSQHWRMDQATTLDRHKLFSALHDLIIPLSSCDREAVLLELANWAGETPRPRAARRQINAEELAALADDRLIDVGSHTPDHLVLAAHSFSVQDQQIRDGKSQLTEILGRPVLSFAYPFGGSAHYQTQTADLVRNAGFECACTAVRGAVNAQSNPFHLPRMAVSAWHGERFARELSVQFFQGAFDKFG